MANERKDYHHNYYLKNKERIITYIRNYREEHLGYQYNRRRETKIKILTHYGNGKCACVQCGESRLPCLSLDHINNDGAKDRLNRIGEKNNYNTKLFLQLIKEDFPQGYQTLCMNCHFFKHYEKQGRY